MKDRHMPAILIVEDHDGVRAGLRTWLSEVFPQYHFLEAKDGETAVSVAAKERPALAVMDIRMPGINGIEATRRIKATAPETRVVMHTILDEAEYRAEAQAAGASAYVSKMRAHSELVPAMRKLLTEPCTATDAGMREQGLGAMS